jgi:hypothetical protein
MSKRQSNRLMRLSAGREKKKTKKPGKLVQVEWPLAEPEETRKKNRPLTAQEKQDLQYIANVLKKKNASEKKRIRAMLKRHQQEKTKRKGNQKKR